MTKNYIDASVLEVIAKWESTPHLDVSYATMKSVVFGLARHVRHLHDAHEKGFQAGVEYQKMLEKKMKGGDA